MRLSELYTSVQGEGPNVGKMTQFIRFAGCNLRCPLWPCDTQHAIDPVKYRHEWLTRTPQQLVEMIDANPRYATFTGGEPFLQNADSLEALYSLLYVKGYAVDIFTNGTLTFPRWIIEPNVTVIMDWKLPGSGEDPENKTRIRNLAKLSRKDAVKFVCAHKEDFIEAISLFRHHWGDRANSMPQVYVGAAWGKVTEAQMVEWLSQVSYPFKLNVQVHNFIFDRSQRGI